MAALLLAVSLAACGDTPVEQSGTSQLRVSPDSVVVAVFTSAAPLVATVRNGKGAIQYDVPLTYVSRDQTVGANRTQQGSSRMSGALAEEVKYYSPSSQSVNAMLVPSVFPGEGLVPLTCGAHLAAGDASGAWVSSTIDLLRLVGGIDGRPSRPDILSPASVAQMTGSGPTVCANGSCHYGFGWFVRPTQGDANWWHGGSTHGATAMLVRTYHNFVWIGLFNGRTVLPINSEPELDAALARAFTGATSFPAHDLFSTFR